MVPRDSVGRDEEAEQKEILGRWNYSVCYCNDGYVTWYTCPNPENFKAREWTLGGSQEVMHVVIKEPLCITKAWKPPHWRAGGGAVLSTCGNGVWKTKRKRSRGGALYCSWQSSSLGKQAHDSTTTLQLNEWMANGGSQVSHCWSVNFARKW